MVSKRLMMMLRWLFWRFEWLIATLIIIILFIDFYLYKYFISIESTFDDKIRVVTALGQITSIFIAAIAISYQVQAAKDREIRFKVHQQRKETYESLLKVMEKIAKLQKEKNSNLVGNMEPDWRELRPKLIVYASPKVISAYKAIERAGIEAKNDPNAPIKRIAELYLQMRSEVGFSAEDVPTRQLLSFLITDIDDLQYNNLFDKDGYLK